MSQFFSPLLAAISFHVVRYQNLIVCLLFLKGLYSKGAVVNNGLSVSPGVHFWKMAKGFRAKDVPVIDICVLSEDP